MLSSYKLHVLHKISEKIKFSVGDRVQVKPELGWRVKRNAKTGTVTYGSSDSTSDEFIYVRWDNSTVSAIRPYLVEKIVD